MYCVLITSKMLFYTLLNFNIFTLHYSIVQAQIFTFCIFLCQMLFFIEQHIFTYMPYQQFTTFLKC